MSRGGGGVQSLCGGMGAKQSSFHAPRQMDAAERIARLQAAEAGRFLILRRLLAADSERRAWPGVDFVSLVEAGELDADEAMASPSISIVGVFQVPADEALLGEAMELKYGGMTMPFWRRWMAKKAVRSELASVVLIECRVDGADGKFEVGDFRQPGSDQAAYDEAFLSEDGTALAADRYKRPRTRSFRVCFFLHFFEPGKPLESSYGTLDLPEVRKMPRRLQRLIRYEPVT